MTFEKGIPVTNVKEIHSQNIDLKRLSSLISSCFIHMIFEKGFVHSDPHPGNLFVRKIKTPKGKDDI